MTLVVLILTISEACEAEYFSGGELASHFESGDGSGDKVNFIFFSLSAYFCCKQCLLFRFFKMAAIQGYNSGVAINCQQLSLKTIVFDDYLQGQQKVHELVLFTPPEEFLALGKILICYISQK